jgi:acyl carrier protein
VTSEAITLQTAIRAVEEVLGPRLGQTPVQAGMSLLELGLDSLDLAELFLVLEESAGQQLDPASAGELERVGDLTRLLPLVASP